MQNQISDATVSGGTGGGIYLAAAARTQYLLVVAGPAGMLVSVRADGTLEYGAGYEPDEAARRFWQALACHAPVS